MLSALRKKKIARRILIVLAILIIPAFMLFGVGNLGKKRVAGFNYVGIIDGKKIGIDDFFKAKRGTELQLILSYIAHKNILDKILKDRPLVNKLTWDRIIMLQEAEKSRIKVSDEEIIAFVTSHPLFLNKGVFDEKFYNYMLTRNLGINARTFEEEMRQALKVEKLKERILKDVFVTDDEALGAYKKDQEKGRISYIRIEKEAFRDNAGVNEDEIRDYYAKFRENYRIPEKINLEYIEFPYGNYDERGSLAATLRAISKKITRKPGRFLSIAEENNRSVEETGLFSKENLPPKFSWNISEFNALFVMEPGDVRIFFDETPEGFGYILKLKEKAPSRLQTEEEAAPRIRNLLISEKMDSLTKEKNDEILSRMDKKNLSLKRAASKFNLPLDETELISRFEYIQGVGPAYDILDNLFKIGKDRVNTFKTRKGYIIVRLDELQEIDNEKFNEEKDAYRNKVLAAKRTKVLTDWLAKISKNATLTLDLGML